MIVCTLDGKAGFPSSADKIKVTYENPFVKDSGSYTYDINFPMAIPGNRRLFGNIQRFDVKKAVPDFEECRLFVGNRLVISGKGTVTSVTNDMVKVQIVGGKSRIKYNSKFEKHFIDEVDYPPVVLDSGIRKDIYQQAGLGGPDMSQNQPVLLDLTTSSFVGQKGVAVLSPVHDESNDMLSNRVVIYNIKSFKINGMPVNVKGMTPCMVNCALQPYLMYVLRKVLEYEGYELVRNDFDHYPWNRLVIVSACKTGKLGDALPHWSVYKFLNEIRKFFNASFVFDEESKKVSMVATNEMLANETVTYDCEDDFTVEYDDDGLDNLATSNVEYAMADSPNRDWRDTISQKVMENFTLKEYQSFGEMYNALEQMNDKEKKTTLFHQNNTYFVWAELPKDGNPYTEEKETTLTRCGFFNPIVRDAKSDNYQKLCIAPAAIFRRAYFDEKSLNVVINNYIKDVVVTVPSVSNEKEASHQKMEQDENGGFYYSVQEAMQGTVEDSTTETTEDDGTMSVAFQADCLTNLAPGQIYPVEYDHRLPDEDTNHRAPVLFTDYRMTYPRLCADTASLSLEALPSIGIGSLRRPDSSDKDRFGEVVVDCHNQVTVKLVTDEIPDPSRIFVIRNKKFICEKIEMEVADDGISKVKTGYFYEIVK